jgi:uroporphyrinogen decarboxylase
VRDLAYEIPAPAAAEAADAPAGSPEPLEAVLRNVPLVHFGVGTGELLKAMHEAGADAVGVDYRIPLDEASRRLGHVVPVQGNVDPAMLDAPWPVLEAHVLDVLDRGREAPAHVLNLGHGVPPETDPGVLTRVVELVHGWRPE